ncbi:MAG: hypothetical protein ACI4WH_05675 [Oscillospiraceae bacterium]
MKDVFLKYKGIIIPLIVTTIITGLFAFYCSGVVDFNIYKDIIDVRLQKIVERLSQDSEERQTLQDEIVSDCEEKAQMVSMLISQSSSELSYELSLEEIRIILNADEITIGNSTGNVEYSTSTYNPNDTIIKEFIPYTNDKTFIKSLSDSSGRIVTGVARLDDDGIIQLTFSSEAMSKMLKSTEVSNVTSEYPLLQNGFTAIINSDTYTYLSHTDISLVGTPSQLPREKFNLNDENGGFFYSVGGTKSYIRYLIYDDNIIVGVVPSSEIYRLRNSLLGWTVFSGLILTLISVLCNRFILIKNK